MPDLKNLIILLVYVLFLHLVSSIGLWLEFGADFVRYTPWWAFLASWFTVWPSLLFLGLFTIIPAWRVAVSDFRTVTKFWALFLGLIFCLSPGLKFYISATPIKLSAALGMVVGAAILSFLLAKSIRYIKRTDVNTS